MTPNNHSVSESETTKTIKSLILPLYLPSVLLAVCNGLLIPVLPLFAGEFDIPYTLIGIIIASEAFGRLLGDIPTGLLYQKLGTRRVMAFGLVSIIITTSLLFWSHSVLQVILLRIVAGVGGAMYHVARTYYISEKVPNSSRGRAISMVGGVLRIGRFLGPIIGGYVAGIFGLRMPFLLFSALCALSLLSVLFFIKKSDHTKALLQQPARQHIFNTSNMLRMLKQYHKVLSTAGIAMMFMQIIRNAPTIIIPLFAADIIGLDVKAIGLILGIAAAIDTSLFIPAGIIMDRFGRKYSILSSILGLTAGLVILPFTYNFTSLLLASLLLGFGNGLGSGSMMTLGADLAPEDLRGEFLGFWWLIGDTGSMGGPFITGTIADLLALQASSWLIAGIGILSALLFSFFVSETLHRQTAPPSRTIYKPKHT